LFAFAHAVRRPWRVGMVAALVAGSLSMATPGAAQALGQNVDSVRLESARSVLSERVVPHMSVGIDPATNQVVLTIGDAATATAGVVSAARAFGSAVRIDHVRGGFGTMVGHFRGGNGIVDANGSGSTCTLGFNVTGGKALTAGHCTQSVGIWRKQNNGQLIGPSIGTNFPVRDFGLIRNDGDMVQFGDITVYESGGFLDITGVAIPASGQIVCKSGVTTHVTCGQVLRTNVTVSFPQGTVFNLIETNLCVQPGDSGGPLYIANAALGLTSGATTGLPCGHVNYRSYFQPVVEALNFFGVSIF
jgi:streptogrisin D